MGIIYKFIQHQLAAKQAKLLAGNHQKLIRIRYDLDYRIIASLLRTEKETQLRILDKAECYFEAEQCYRNLEAWEKVVATCEK